MFSRSRLLVAVCFASALPLLAQAPKREPRELIPPPFDKYLERRVAEIAAVDWQKDITAANWPERQAKMRAELQRMLGLDPWPARGDLKPVITGTVKGDGYVVEKLHFQSLPGLYVTANLYRPEKVTAPLPAVLYVCGHANVVEAGVSLGNKTGYQHHGSWFARHGYVCLIIDTIQLGEIRGEHHGTFSKKRWWWPARGYTPAGVEAWNGIRALDYLETRPEVDKTKFAVTGRSGGGAYSWWIAALDERIKVAVPTAGITNQHNHLIDGAIEGHCDCMFMVNAERWDFDRVAALVAPRPLLIANTDSDGIFPLDGVVDVFNRTRALYRRIGKEDRVGLHIAEGPHKDTQPLNTGAFHWINRWLKGADRMDVTDEPATKRHEARELRVFTEIPADEKVTKVDEFFVPAATSPGELRTQKEWVAYRDDVMKALRSDCFRAWPTDVAKAAATAPATVVADGLALSSLQFESEPGIPLTLWLLQRDGLKPEELELVVLNVLDDAAWKDFSSMAAAAFPAQFAGAKAAPDALKEERGMLLKSKWAMAYVAPRAIGPQSWEQLSANKQTQLRRRLLLIGESLEGGQVWDVQQAAATLRAVPGFSRVPLWMQSQNIMAANTLYAALFIPDVKRLDLHGLPVSHREGPIYLNVLRHLDLPQAAALAAEHSTLAIYADDASPWGFAQNMATTLHWGEKRVQVRKPMEPATSR